MNIDIDRGELASICEEYDVKRLLVFGSALTDQFHEQSDVDILVEFSEDNTPSLFLLGGLQQKLSSLFNREVDLKTPKFFDKSDREAILR